MPYPPGGGVDLTARLLMEPLVKELGQTIVVDNKGGAGGLIGVTAMAQSPPDGYTHRRHRRQQHERGPASARRQAAVRSR